MRKTPVPGIERRRPLAITAVRMPAEWEQQDALLLVWPHPAHGWRAGIATVESAYTELVYAVCERQPVIVVVQDETHHHHISARLESSGIDPERCRLITIATDDCWARDTGPLSVFNNGTPELLDFQFNGWGGKYPHAKDNQLNTRLKQSDLFACAMRSIPLILEGGSIDTDGQGTLLTTQSCLLSATRNSSYDRNKLEQLFERFLGMHTIHWLQHGAIEGDDTDGHIDTLARFCPGNTIAYSACTDKTDVNYPSLQWMEQELNQLRTADNKKYTLVPLPLPSAIMNNEGRRLPANYANFQIINGAVLYPRYHDPMDPVVQERLQAVFPQHDIIGLDARAIIEQFGSLHCLCMQLTNKAMSNE